MSPLYLSAQIYSPFQTSKTAPGPKSALDSCWFVKSPPLSPQPNLHLKISTALLHLLQVFVCPLQLLRVAHILVRTNSRTLSLSISHTNNFISRTRHHHLHHSRLFFLVIYFITFDTIFCCSHSHNNFINYCQRRTNITTTTVSIICYSAQLAIKHLRYQNIVITYKAKPLSCSFCLFFNRTFPHWPL